ncbi:hypothetical protein BG015_001524 [Linnemannia schmuckeri]|uniref:F-box domain-containing protein n=1 Tax=Linnemannia schmuckeri TaxID=64567 RepID=A0A9P5RSE9_9FUNG|nr:hypothetical protein BG015_001524 [Linnemannia schmuckeri]
MPRATFSSLPVEIVTLITIHLNRHDLAQCTRVCHHWSIYFSPSLWRVVEADTWFCDEERLAILAKHAHFIREIEFVNNPRAAKVLALGTEGGGLRSLIANFEWKRGEALPQLELPPEQDQAEAEAEAQAQPEPSDTTTLGTPRTQQWQIEGFGNARLLGDLLIANQNLKFVSADETCFRHSDGTDAFQFFIACCPSSLERLELRFRNHPTSLASVADNSTLYNDLADTHITLFASAPEISILGSFKFMKELVISGGNCHIGPHRLAFLGLCPNLERLQLDNIDKIPMAALSAALRMSCPQLSILELKGPYRGGDDDLAFLLSSAKSHWKEVSLPDMDDFGIKAFTVLMESVVMRLEVLKVGGWGEIHGGQFLDLLCSAQHLRRMEGLADGELREITMESTMWAYAAFYLHTYERDRSWALGPSMEFLQIWIDDIPRPDLVCRRNGEPISRYTALPEGEGDEHFRYDVQRWVYTQLGRLTGLQNLILGVKELDPRVLSARGLAHLDPIALEEVLRFVVPTFIYRSMEFSLESGLGLLVGLKELRFLDVKSTAHRIGVTELDWMHVNWPKLKEIKGLVSAREWAGDAEAGLAVKAAVEEWMDAHPYGIGSYYYSGSIIS